jgi:hypothetical protein
MLQFTAIVITICVGGCVMSSDARSHGGANRSDGGSNFTAVDLEVGSLGPPPVLIAYRNHGGAWQMPRATPIAGHYTLQVAHVYQYLVVCAQGGLFDAELYGATEQDGPQQYAFCVTTTPPTPPQVTVTGTMIQAGTVTLGGGMATTIADAPFSLQTLAGDNDLIAFDATSVMVKRDQSITASTSLGTLDLASKGSPLDQVTLSISNTDADFQGTAFTWFTPHGMALWDGSGSQLGIPPAALLQSDDEPFIEADDDSPDFTTSRDVSYVYDPRTGILPLVLPDAIANPTFDTSTPAVTGSWTRIPPSMGMWLNVGVSATYQSTGVQVTASWLAEMGADKLTFDISPPPNGYQSAWQIAPTAPISAMLDATSASSTRSAYSMYRAALNGAPLARLPESTHSIRRARGGYAGVAQRRQLGFGF